MIMLLSGGLYTLAAKASQVLRRRLRGLQRQFYFKRSATLASRRFLPSTGCVLRPLAQMANQFVIAARSILRWNIVSTMPCWSMAVRSLRCAIASVPVRAAAGSRSRPPVRTARTARLAREVSAASAVLSGRGANPRRQSPAGASIVRPMPPCRCCRTGARGRRFSYVASLNSFLMN